MVADLHGRARDRKPCCSGAHADANQLFHLFDFCAGCSTLNGGFTHHMEADRRMTHQGD
jgi:hypothetical protein